MSEKTLRTALWLAARGLPRHAPMVADPMERQADLRLPQRRQLRQSPGKHPLSHWKGRPIVPNGKDSATTDSGVIKHWFQTAPDANLGVCHSAGCDGARLRPA